MCSTICIRIIVAESLLYLIDRRIIDKVSKMMFLMIVTLRIFTVNEKVFLSIELVLHINLFPIFEKRKRNRFSIPPICILNEKYLLRKSI